MTKDPAFEYHCKHISTHTLTWSVTYLKIDTKRPTKISTHTLTWSVTKDPAFEYHCKHISTHTLTWSVTQTDASSLTVSANFNSHAHVERDISISFLIVMP